jgi:hypothetical protein
MNDIPHHRARSLSFVQILFAVFALLSLVAALAVSTRGVDMGLPEQSRFPISLAFLLIGVVDTVLLYAWERIYQRVEPDTF